MSDSRHDSNRRDVSNVFVQKTDWDIPTWVKVRAELTRQETMRSWQFKRCSFVLFVKYGGIVGYSDSVLVNVVKCLILVAARGFSWW